MDRIPISIPMLKPVQIRTRGARVRVWTDTGTDDLKNTHGLLVSNTTRTRYIAIMLAFRPPGMLVAELYIPFLAVALYSKSLILLHDYQQ